MRNSQTTKSFWRDAVRTTVMLAALVVLWRSATPLFTFPQGRLVAMMVELMGSRSILFNRAVGGYYERLSSPHAFATRTWSSPTFVDDPFRLRRLRPNLRNVTDWAATNTPTNSYGYIGPEWPLRKQPNTRRVALLGDSVTEGRGVDLSQSFGTLLENRLNATHPAGLPERFEFLNYGVDGYHLPQMLDVALNDVPPFSPDVYMVGLTELSVFRSWDSHLVYLIESGGDVKYDSLRDVVRMAGASKRDDISALEAKLAPYRIPILREMILRMKSNAEQYRAAFLVVLVPSVEDADLTKKRFAGTPELLRSLHVTFIDLSDTFDGILDRESVRLSRTDVHPNSRGHIMIYNNLYAKLRADPAAWAALVGADVKSRQ